MRQVLTWTPVVVLVLCALVLPAQMLRADGGGELQKNLLAATVRAIELEIEAAKQKLNAAEKGTGPKENVERFRQKIRDLEAEQGRSLLPPCGNRGRRLLRVRPERAVSARLEVVPSGLLSRDYEVRENGTPVGTIENRPLHLREKGMVTANGREYTVLRERVLRANYLLRAADGETRARAERKGLAGSVYRLLFDASQILLRKKMLAMRETYLILYPSGEAGSIVRESLLSRRMAVELEKSAAGTE